MAFGQLIFFVSALLLAFVYGLATVQFEIFPYEIIRQAKNCRASTFLTGARPVIPATLPANVSASGSKRPSAGSRP